MYMYAMSRAESGILVLVPDPPIHFPVKNPCPAHSLYPSESVFKFIVFVSPVEFHVWNTPSFPVKNPDPRCVVYRTVDTYRTVQLHSTVLVVISSTTVPYVLCIRICTVLRIGMTMYVCDQDPASLAGH